MNTLLTRDAGLASINSLLRGAEVVERSELQYVGTYGSYAFQVGDIFEFPKEEKDVIPCYSYFSEADRIAGVRKVYYVNAVKNDRLKFVPIGMFKRKPHNFAELLSEYNNFTKDICECENFEVLTYELLLGKRIKVSKLIDAKKQQYIGSVAQVNEDGSPKLIDTKVPIFEPA